MMPEFNDDVLTKAAAQVGAEFGMNATDLIAHALIGDQRHPDDDVCGAASPHDSTLWCGRAPTATAITYRSTHTRDATMISMTDLTSLHGQLRFRRPVAHMVPLADHDTHRGTVYRWLLATPGLEVFELLPVLTDHDPYAEGRDRWWIIAGWQTAAAHPDDHPSTVIKTLFTPQAYRPTTTAVGLFRAGIITYRSGLERLMV